MDENEPVALAVHRCRFVDYAPSAITALAYPPLPLPLAKRKSPAARLRFGTLAIGHANGNIDLCEWSSGDHSMQSYQAWVIRKTLAGLHPSKVDSLCFSIRYPEDFQADEVPSTSDLRLFSSGGGSDVLEWDLERGFIRRTISSQAGSVWCMAVNPVSSMLALGCEDGTVRLMSLVNDTLTHFRRFERVKCRVLSIAWGVPVLQQHQAPSKDSDSDDDLQDHWKDSWLVTGGSDSSIRKWDVATGRPVDRMGTDKIRGERTLVWSIAVLGDGTIVSGDSLGIVKFWDSRTCTQLQSFQAHGADVLCLAVGPEGQSVYSSGVDQKTCQFSFIKTDSETLASSISKKWIQSCSRRMHSHDVRAMATWPPYTPLPPPYARQFPADVAPILASGGLDMFVVLSPVTLPSNTGIKITNPLCTSVDCTFENSYHRRIAYTSGASSTLPVRLAKQARFLSCVREAGLTLWHISPTKSFETGDESIQKDDNGERSSPWEKVLEVDLNVQTNLIASAVANSGEWLVVSDLYEAKLFHLDIDHRGHVKKFRRIKEFTSILQDHIPKTTFASTGGLAFHFTPDSSRLIMATAVSSYILVIDLCGGRPQVLRRFDHHRMRNAIFRNRIVKGRRLDDDIAMSDQESSGAPVEGEGDSDEDGSDDVSPVLANVLRMAVSSDGQWLATSDDRCRTHVFNLDSIQHHSILPSFSKPAQVLAFDPSHPSTLLLAFSDNTLQIYDVEARQFPAWGRDICGDLPKRLLQAHDPVMGLTFGSPDASLVAKGPRYALLWGSTWIYKLALSAPSKGDSNKKRRRESVATAFKESAVESKMISHYRPILLVDSLEAGELVVVERPLVDVLSTLPPAYFRHKYGVS